MGIIMREYYESIIENDEIIEKRKYKEEYFNPNNGRYIAIYLDKNNKIYKYTFGVIGDTYKTEKEISASDMHYFRKELMN